MPFAIRARVVFSAKSQRRVTHLGTNNVARDIDMLRRALGEKQITYAAGSYGSELGAVYASLFPERLSALLLDGTATPIHRDYLVEFLSEFSTAFEHSFRRLDQLCRRDPACRLADTGVVAAFDDIAARLKDAPVTSPEGTVLTAALFADIIAVLLDRESTLPGRVIAFEPSSQRQTSGARPVDGAFPDFWGTPPVPRGLPTRVR